MTGTPNLFTETSIGKLALKNRLAVAPMTRVSASTEGLATDDMVRYYARFARGGYGLLITEGVYPDLRHSQGYLNQPGIGNDAQASAWRKMIEGVHADYATHEQYGKLSDRSSQLASGFHR
jgi:2,4-dienoyl-CoA reductase-like NADH-dependent reductase (Old Yellow Enzyme family)